MGNCDCIVKDLDENTDDNPDKLKLDDFILLYPISRGGFGLVWKVRLKRQYKAQSLIYYAFHDADKLYIIMNYLSGGDLRYHICIKDYFSEEENKFIAACITLCLNYIHEKNVIHRDLKPENLVMEGMVICI